MPATVATSEEKPKEKKKVLKSSFAARPVCERFSFCFHLFSCFRRKIAFPLSSLSADHFHLIFFVCSLYKMILFRVLFFFCGLFLRISFFLIQFLFYLFPTLYTFIILPLVFPSFSLSVCLSGLCLPLIKTRK